MEILRKLTLLLVALLLALPVSAGRVSQQRAADVAADFFGTGAKRGGSVLTPVESSSSAFAVFNREGGGFVVIALNDAVAPVVAYSPEGRFPSRTEIPDGFEWWLSQVEIQLSSLGDDAVATEEVRAKWESPSPVRGSSKLYETASWSQHEPFNYHCPVVDDQFCITGCVATAGAILARYFKWPDYGVGTVPARPADVGGAYYPSHELGYAYDWDNMPLEYYYDYSQEEADAVATLMYDMGTIAKMGYGLDGSIASSRDLLDGLKEYMKYDRSAYVARRIGYSESAWVDLLKETLDNYGPTIFSGADTGGAGGHTFILDGYDADGLFHFNWGWGFDNCYCEITNLDAGIFNFSASQEVIVGLVPDYSGSSTGGSLLEFMPGNGYEGITVFDESITQYVRFDCQVGNILCNSNDFYGKIYVSLYDKNGNLKQDIDIYGGLDVQIPSNAFIYYSRITCCITTTIEPGDRIKIRYVGQGKEGVINSGAGCTTEVIVMPDGGGDDPPDPTAGYSAAETAATTSLHYDRASGILTLTFTHPSNWAVKNLVGAVVDNGVAIDGGAVTINLSGYTSGTYTVSIGSAESPFSFTITK